MSWFPRESAGLVPNDCDLSLSWEEGSEVLCSCISLTSPEAPVFDISSHDVRQRCHPSRSYFSYYESTIIVALHWHNEPVWELLMDELPVPLLHTGSNEPAV